MPVNLEAFVPRAQIKKCGGPCGERKLVEEFWADPKNLDGRSNRCIDCTKQAREERKQARIEGRPLPTITEERRQELSRQAKERHEMGLIGGSEYGKLGGRPRKVRLNDAVLNHFQQDDQTKLVIRAYESNLRSNSKVNRLRAAEALVAMETRDDELKAKLRGAGKKPEDMTQEELQELLEQGLAAMIERGEIEMPPGFLDTTASEAQAA